MNTDNTDKKMNTKTPRTDEIAGCLDAGHKFEAVGKILLLERDLNEAKQEPLFSQRLVPKLTSERDAWRRMADELAAELDAVVAGSRAIAAYKKLKSVSPNPCESV